MTKDENSLDMSNNELRKFNAHHDFSMRFVSNSSIHGVHTT